MFEHSTPLGPWLVTTDELTDVRREITCEVNGEEMQRADTADLVFDPVALVPTSPRSSPSNLAT